MISVNERTTAYLSVTFRDKAGDPAAPTAVQYRIDCTTTGQAVRGMTAVTPASAVEITLTADDNAIRVNANRSEIRRVTVVASYGSSTDQVTSEHDYSVTNMPFVS